MLIASQAYIGGRMLSVSDGFDLSGFRYRVLKHPTTSASQFEIDSYNRVFNFWKDFWTRVFQSNGASTVPIADNFKRQDAIAVLEYEGEICGLSLHSQFNLHLASDREHTYMSTYPEHFWDKLRSRNTHSIMTYEYLTVRPEFRRSLIGLSLGSVLIGLGLRIAQEANVDSVIAPARRDVGVHRLAHDQGAVSIVKNITLHETPCDLIVFYRDAIHLPHEAVHAELIERLWSAYKNESQQRVAA